jgi:glycosyltransferase involved in cell wall biosynthesis
MVRTQVTPEAPDIGKVDSGITCFDIVMVSDLGAAAGGRETWLAQFLSHAREQRRSWSFRVICRKTAQESVLKEMLGKNEGLLSLVELSASKSFIPITMKYIFEIIRFRLRDTRRSDYVIAVGGFSEALATVLAYPLWSPKRRIIWLRSIYTKEKAREISVFTLRAIAYCYDLLLRFAFFHRIANGFDTAAFYAQKGYECSVIENGVDLDRYKAIERNDGVFRIAFVGRLADVKGIGHFVEAAYLLEAQSTEVNFSMHVAGSGPSEPVVREAESRLSKFHYHGPIDNKDMPAFLSSMDCCVALTFVTPDWGGAGVSNALLEQMASEKIIIAWRNAVFSSILTSNECWFVEQGSAKDLADTMVRAMLHQVDSRARGQRARARAEQYSMNAHVRRFAEFVQDRLSAPHI